MKHFFLTFIKGLAMGIADIIPGVSGGTIALIAGIYEHLILSLDNARASIFRSIRNLNLVYLKSIDLQFFIPLGLGIGSALFILSGLITFLLINYESPTFAFFTGVIIGSIYFLIKTIKTWNFNTYITIILGVICGWLISGLQTVTASSSPLILFISAVLAITAMILPGISGSFILLILGQYGYLIEAIHTFDIISLIIFGSGAVIGLFTSVRGIAYLFRKWEQVTLSFLVGIMVGAMRAPLQKIIFSWLSFLLFIVGFIIILILERKHSILIEDKL